MRQMLLMLAIIIGSPLAMAQDPGGVAASAATAATPAVTLEKRDVVAHKPVSAIGRALAGLMQEAHRRAASRHADIRDAVVPSDIDAAHPAQLSAQADPGDAP